MRFNAPAEEREARARQPELDTRLFLLMAMIAEDYLTEWIRAHRRRRCPFCHARANPPALSIDGSEYARRRRARRRAR